MSLSLQIGVLIGRPSMACAIREAYAACLNVVILVEALESEDDA